MHLKLQSTNNKWIDTHTHITYDANFYQLLWRLQVVHWLSTCRGREQCLPADWFELLRQVSLVCADLQLTQPFLFVPTQPASRQPTPRASSCPSTGRTLPSCRSDISAATKTLIFSLIELKYWQQETHLCLDLFQVHVVCAQYRIL